MSSANASTSSAQPSEVFLEKAIRFEQREKAAREVADEFAREKEAFLQSAVMYERRGM